MQYEMNKELAAKIMGVDIDADNDELIRRYGIIVKRMKNESEYIPAGMDRAVSADEVNAAFNFLMGIDLTDEADKIEDEDAREMFIMRRKFKTFFQYNGVRMALIAFFILVFAYGIFLTINNKESEFAVVFYGNYACDNLELMKTNLQRDLPELGEIDLRTVIMTNLLTNTVKNENRAQLASMMAGDNLDVLILDYTTYREYAQYGYLVDIKEYLSDEEYERETEYNPNLKIENEKGEVWYGFDITGIGLMDDYGFSGTDYIFCVCSNTSRQDKVLIFLKYIMDMKVKDLY